MLEFKNLEEQYIKEACKLAQEEYRVACRKNDELIPYDFEIELQEMITELFQNGQGKVALQQGSVIGYIAFWGPWEGCFGNVKGVFSPLGGSAFGGQDRGKLASRLFQEVAKDLAKDNVFSFALSRYAEDEELGKAFVMNGFGIRCTDAIMKLSKRSIISEQDNELIFRVAQVEDAEEVSMFMRGLVRHLCKSPTFFPTNIKDYSIHVSTTDLQRIFVVKDKQKVIGYMQIENEAETFITTHEEIVNICGMFILPEYRGMGIAQQLLEYVCKSVEDSGKKYLGVDCETLNPNALSFWGKYFKKYTYSYIRRIDERIQGYEEYLDEIWKVNE